MGPSAAEPRGVMGVPAAGSRIPPRARRWDEAPDGLRSSGIARSHRRQHSPSGLAAALGTSRANKSPLRGSFHAVLRSLPVQRLLSPFSCLSQYFSLSLRFAACAGLGAASAGATAKHSHALRLLGAGRSREHQGPHNVLPSGQGAPPKSFLTLNSSRWTKPPAASPGACGAHFGYDVHGDVGNTRSTPTADPA